VSAGLAPAPGPASVVELDLGSSRSCFAEYHWAGTDAVAVVLLHDEGADLDSVRDLAIPLAQQGFSVLSLDLPGHGLSSGDFEDDAPLAIAAAALFADPHDTRGVAFIAVGATSAHLVNSPVRNCLGMVLVDPRAVPHNLPVGSVWRSTPSLFIVDPSDTEADAATELLAGQVRAWNVRCFVHRQAASSRPQHIRALSTKFLLEQSAYRVSRDRPVKDRA